MSSTTGTGADGDNSAERIPDIAPTHSRLYLGLSGWMLATEARLRSHGGRRLRIGVTAFWSVVALAGVFLLVGPVINKPLTLDDITDSATTATARWIARDFGVDYRLSVAPDGTLRAEVEERITAFFADDTDEQGIRRVLATQYQGHALNPTGVAATLDGVPVTVGQAETPTRLALTVKGSETLHGDHDIVLRYTLANLAYPAVDSGSDQPIDLLEWDVFGPSWPQAFAGLDVSVTIPQELDDKLIGQPRGSLAWTLIGTGDWLDREPRAGPDVTYQFTNHQNMPPHAQAWFTMKFEPGTIVMPPPTPLVWFQTLGPLAPLMFLALTLLLACAARAVAWDDARGRPWFVAQSEIPKKMTPRMAAQILRARWTGELAGAVADAQTGPRRRPQNQAVLTHAARVAARTGKLGDRPRAISRFLTAPERRAQFTEGFRRVPRGFVRDLFIAAPIALTIVQWGLVRQLSYQAELAVVWWPVAFVLASTAIAAVVLWIALSVRPLTRRGALMKQHLLGIGVYADRTRLLERAEPSERLLPYAVLTATPREAGARVVDLIEGQAGGAGASNGWRGGEFVTWQRVLTRVLAVAVVAVAIALPVALPTPYPQGVLYDSYFGNLPGNTYTEVTSIDAAAVLTRSSDGAARVDVTERLVVDFDPTGSRVPQFVQQWPSTIEGQDLGLQVESVLIDGRDVSFTTQQDLDTTLLRTTLVDVLTGTLDVQIVYSLTSAAVATEYAGSPVDSVRWAALLDGWEYNSQWGYALSADSIRITFSIANDLAKLATTGGWISRDTTSAEEAREWAASVVPFGAAESAGSTQSHLLEVTRTEFGGWPFEYTVDDVGAQVVFPTGTFTGPNVNAARAWQFGQVAPLLAVLTLGALGFGLGLAGAISRFTRARRVFVPGLFRDLVRWFGPAATLATAILFGWTTADMPTAHEYFAALGLSTVAALLGSTTGLILTRASRRGAIPGEA